MTEPVERSNSAEPDPTVRARIAAFRWGTSVAFVVVTLLPVMRRLRSPTILGDDVTRIVDLIKYPFREHLFLPFSEHIAPLFQLVSSVTWELIGHDIRLAPLGFSAASVCSWALVLGLFAFWLLRETGSRTATLVAVSLAAQSPLVLETAWWYSASSFLWAIAGILTALIGAGYMARRPPVGLMLIGLGAALGLAGTTLGILAAPLAIVRAGLDPTASHRKKIMSILAAGAGVFLYRVFCRVGGVSSFHTDPGSALPDLDLVGGIGYALSVPGRILWPSLLGVPISRMVKPIPIGLCIGAGGLALAATMVLACWPRARWNRRLVIVAAAMIYGAYGLTYSARTIMVTEGKWTEPQLLYEYAARYHVLPLLGAIAMLAALLGSWPLVRRCDGRRGRPALLATLVGLIMMVVQAHEASHWNWMLRQPDQRRTLAAVNRVGQLAKIRGISRPQLLRIFDAVYRPWNGSVLTDRPYAFHLMNLAVAAPEHVEHPLSDTQARERLLPLLKPQERIALASGACVPPASITLKDDSRTLSIARRVGQCHVREESPGDYRQLSWPAFIEFEFDPSPVARYLVLPGLAADQDLLVCFGDNTGCWQRGRNVRWLKSPKIDAAIDLGSLFHWLGPPPSRIRVQFTARGALALDGPPRLLR